jgi:MFS family permease
VSALAPGASDPSATQSRGTPDRWLVLTLVALDYFILYAHRSLIGYLKTPLMVDLDINSEEFGWLGTAFFLPYAVAQVGVGYLGDRFARRSIILVSLLASALGLAAMGLARNFAEMFALRVLLGTAQSATVPAIASAVADSFTPRTRSTAVGIYLMSYNLALILAATFSGRIADTPVWHVPLVWSSGQGIDVAGWRIALFLFAGAGGLAALLFWALFREPPRTERAQAMPLPFRRATAVLLRVPTFWAITWTFVLSSMAVLAIQLWLAGYLKQRFDLSLEEAGFQATLWIQGNTVVGLFAGGKLGDWLARRWLAGRTAVQVAGLLATVPALILIGAGGALAWLAVPMIVYGFGIGLYQSNLWPTTFEVVDPGARSTAIGMLNVAAGSFGVWCHPLIGIYEQEHGDVGRALAALSILMLAAAALLAFSGTYLLPRDYRGPLRPAV